MVVGDGRSGGVIVVVIGWRGDSSSSTCYSCTYGDDSGGNTSLGLRRCWLAEREMKRTFIITAVISPLAQQAMPKRSICSSDAKKSYNNMEK